MKQEKNIDILLATYNGEKYLKEQIDSILSQTYKNINLIISDDASTDGTKEILKQYEKKDSRIKIFYQEKNLGYVKNFEFLLKQVKSDVFMLSDQDDVWLPEKVEKTYEKLKKENADLAFGDLEVVDQELNTMCPSFNDFMKLSRKIKKYINSYKLNYLYCCITGCTLMLKSKWIPKILPIPEDSKRLIHDHWIGIMVGVNGGKSVYVPEKYIKYRQHGDNQVGTEKISHKFKKLEQVRDLFIDVKLGVFGTYVKNEDRFPKDLQKLNREAYNYFEMLENKKRFNFRKWNVFHKLYKTETFMYYIENFLIMNMPFLAKGLFNIRYAVLKLMGKR